MLCGLPVYGCVYVYCNIPYLRQSDFFGRGGWLWLTVNAPQFARSVFFAYVLYYVRFRTLASERAHSKRVSVQIFVGEIVNKCVLMRLCVCVYYTMQKGFRIIGIWYGIYYVYKYKKRMTASVSR